MKLNNIVSSVNFLSVLVLISMRLSLGLAGNGGFIGMKKTKTPALGGVHNCKGMQNSVEIESLARFAVQEHNKNENALLEFGRVLKAKEQVVAGKIYYLTLEVIDAGKKMVYDAKVWVKPWMKFKELQEFKYSPNGLLMSSPDHGEQGQ